MRLSSKEYVMKYSKLIFVALMSVFTVPGFAADADNNPPGQAGGPGPNWENRPGMQGGPGMSPDRRPRLSAEQREKLKAMSPEERKALLKKMREERMARDSDSNPPGQAGGPGTNWENRPGMQGGPGMSPDRRPRLSDEQREKLKAMSPEERKAFVRKMHEKRAQMRGDRDNNPPGAAGGVGTNWENRPGPQGGPGSSPDRIPRPER
jgi:Spy/CpxP family protein refolding chaperone